ncbi:glycosyltransferase family 4 protein [Rhodanobacter sp. 7MK24]|uniref:glycosyltransferase family 4 protein n=1 Tax=Rhodanobacter sp. 7MK24 TaxID=2775922 RepID=UPI0031BB1AF2
MHELARRLVDRFRVIVLCPHAIGALPHEILDGVEVVRYRYAPESWETLVNDGGIVNNLRLNRWKYLLVPGFVLAQVWHAWRILCKENIEAIHAHWLIPQGLIAALLQCLPGARVPFVATAHGSDLQALHGLAMDALRRFVARKASRITVVSNMLRDALGSTDVSPSKIRVLPMGVDLDGRFVPDGNSRRSANEILFVGRLVDKKGVDRLLDAMPEVLRRVPGAKLVVAGHGPMFTALKEQSERLGVSGRVDFLGAIAQRELPALYRRAALFVAPFDKGEGLGLVLVEAIGCGCPVLAGDAPAAVDIFGEAWAEHVVDPRDAGALSARIVAALESPKIACERAERLRGRVSARFGWDGVAEAYGAILKECVAGEA